jgi:hypothetical protein
VAWPFASVLEPNLNTGPGVAVPTTPAAITAAPAWLVGAHFTNAGADSVTVTLTNTAGGILAQLQIPPGGEQPYEWPFRPTLGVKWSADLAGVVGQVWGYT